MLVLLLFLGVSIGVLLSVYAKYSMHYIRDGEHSALKWLLMIGISGVLFLALFAASYILSLSIFEHYDTRSGRTMLFLSVLVPFWTTVLIEVVRHWRRR